MVKKSILVTVLLAAGALLASGAAIVLNSIGATNDLQLGSTFIRPTTRITWTSATGTNLYVTLLTHGIVYEDHNVSLISARVNPVTSKPDYGVIRDGRFGYLFDASSTETASFSLEMPHAYARGSAFQFHAHAYPKDGSTSTRVVLSLSCVSSTPDGVMDALSTTSTITEYVSGTAFKGSMMNFATNTATGIVESQQFSCSLSRQGDHENDTYGDDLWITTVGIHYPTNKFGTLNLLGH